MTDGTLTQLDISVTSQLEAAGLTMNVTDLDFDYNSTGNQYEIDSGNLSFSTSEGFSFSADFGLPDPSNSSVNLPGLVISDGNLTEFNAALYANFTVAGLVITVDDMAMIYSAGEYEMYGTVLVNTTNINFNGTIGQPNASSPVPGLIIDNGSLIDLNITLNSNVTLGDLTVNATNLTFNYQSDPYEFTLYGNVGASIAGVDLDGALGNATDPGLTLVNGQLDEFNLGVTANFTLFGLSCDVQNLTFQYEDENGSTDYVLYGDLSLSVSGNDISATMGDAASPGLVIDNGVVNSINMSISGSFQLFGFGFNITDASCIYNTTGANGTEYEISGTFTLSDFFTASVQLGTDNPDDPGIIITDGGFTVENFAFSLDNVPIGAFTLNYIDLSYAAAGDVWSGAGQVTFPTGWSVSANITFDGGSLESIGLAYNAGTSSGIAIPDTGMFVTEISGYLQNLDEPPNIIVSGSIQAVFGKQITISGISCAIFAATGSFTADSQELVIQGDYYQGAYQTNGNWQGILGNGSASVDLDWAAGDYSASVSESMYEGVFVISASLAFDDSGDLGIIATAAVEIPDGVPFIGGTKLGSMSFAFIYTASSNTGTVAAWATVNLYFTSVTTGFEYSFSDTSSGAFSLIGSGGVNQIENSFNSITSSDESTPTTYVYLYSVTVSSGSGSDGLSVQATWPANSGTQTLEISGPNDNGTYYSLSSSPPSSDNDQFLTQYTTTTSQSVITNGSATNQAVALPAGTYNFEVESTYEFASTSDVTFTNQLYYQPPTVAITAVPSQALNFVPSMTGFAAGALSSNTTITLYAQTSSSGYAGKEVGSFGYSANSNGTLQDVPTINLSDYSPGVAVYIYAIINDGTNSAVYSALSSAIIPLPNLVGQVLDQFGNPIAGLTIFLDLNNDGTYDVPNVSANGTSDLVADPSTVTDTDGDFFFNDLESYQNTDVLYPNFNVTALMPSPSFTPITPSDGVDTIDNDSDTTGSIVADFQINRLASISGSLYSDLNQDGVYTSTDPALSGATVYLDSTGTGTYQSGDPTCETGPSGTYGFYDLNAPATYNIGIIDGTTTGTSTVDSGYEYIVTEPTSATYSISVASDSQQLTGNTFGVISLGTVSGEVTSQTTEGPPASQSGTAVNISTPDTTASVPNYTTFSSSQGLTLSGSTVSSSGSLTMLGASQSLTATATWYTSPVPLLGGFQTDYQWSMTSAGATSGGFAFVLQNEGSSAVGSTAYGYGAISPSIAVIFDAVDNEILIESDGNTDASSASAVLTSAELGFTLASGTIYTARITFQPTDSSGFGTLSVYLSGDSSGGLTPLLSTSVNLASLLALGTSGTAVVGFTAGTAGTGLAISIDSWSFLALNTESTTSDSNGNYTFTGLYPATTYTVSQVLPSGEIQSSPFDTEGVYSEQGLSPLKKYTSSVVSGDFNDDGLPDVAYAISLDSAPYEFAWAAGNGNGSFGTLNCVSIPVPSGSPTLATPGSGGSDDAFLASGDFDSTSYDSVAYVAPMAGGGDVVVIYDLDLNTVIDMIEITAAGVGTSFGQNLPANANAWTINNVVAGDLNNDGYDDLAVSTYGGVYTLIGLNSSSGGVTTWTTNPQGLATPFGTPSLIGSSSSAFNAGVAIADFNQDGNLDLATVGVQYIPDVESGVYGPVDTWTNMTVVTTIQLAYGTGNGSTFTAQSQQTVQDYTEQDIDQYFSSSSSSPTFPIPTGVTAADINGDGIPDLVLNGYTDTLQPAVIGLVQSSGDFTNAGVFLIPDGRSFNVNSSFGDNVVVSGSSLVAAQVTGIDLNGDGFIDIAAVDPNVGQIMLLTTSAAPLTDGQTETVLEFSGGALPQFAAADYSQDGYPDLVVPGQNDQTSQAAPEIILNGTLNVGTFTYTPTNGEVLTGQDFADINFASSSSIADYVASGTPQVAVPSSTVTIAGRVYFDRNQNLKYSAGEVGMGGLTLYLDVNHNGRFDPATDPSTTTDALGYYTFAGLAPGATYDIAIANLPSSYSAPEMTVQTPASSRTGIVERFINVTQLWSIPQSISSIDPLTPIAIDLSPLSLRESLGMQPRFVLAGTVPSGMTIDPYTGEISWTAPYSYAGSTVDVMVRILGSSSPSALDSQWNEFQIQVSNLSPVAAYIRDVFGALLSRLPTTAELEDWVGRLQSGTSLLSFVSAIAHSDERYGILVNNVYRNVLSVAPTPSENSAAVAMLQAGGNSDMLTRELLVSTAFMNQHPGLEDYVNAVNEVLLFRDNTPAMTRREVTWLRRGMSRTRLVMWISRSHDATMAKARQLSQQYLGGPSSKKTLSQWAMALSKGTLNTDSLTTRILASQAYVNGWRTRIVPNIQPPGTTTSPQYNRLNHLAFRVTGSNASRSELDQLETALYDGQSWRSVASNVYNSSAAVDFRIQTQFQNLLGRTANENELTTLSATLPAANQTQALQIQILSSPEYRAQFASTTSYVNSAYQVLTGTTPTSDEVRSWTDRLGQGLSQGQFVHDIAASRAGRTGQVQRLYQEYLGSAPSAAELRAILDQYPKTTLQDRPVTLKLVTTSEFRIQQQAAQLLPV